MLRKKSTLAVHLAITILIVSLSGCLADMSSATNGSSRGIFDDEIDTSAVKGSNEHNEDQPEQHPAAMDESDSTYRSGWKCSSGERTSFPEGWNLSKYVDGPNYRGAVEVQNYTVNASQLMLYSDCGFYATVWTAEGDNPATSPPSGIPENWTQVWPSEAPGEFCWAHNGDRYNSTGPQSALWFNYNGAGCGAWKVYNITGYEQVKIRAVGDDCPPCALWHLDYYILEPSSDYQEAGKNSTQE